MTKTEHRISTAYHPQTNGLVERYNQTIQRALLKLVRKEQDDWDQYIDGVLFGYRTAVQKSTKFMDIQKQSGGYDCGVFSIAFATALVFGEKPGCFLFDQKKMRAHLLQCFERQQMSMFPIMRKRRTGNKVKSFDEILVYCMCRMPELPNSRWIECSSCNEWYHSETCVKVPLSLPKHASWYCAKCTK